jgi:DNA replication protein DnaC
MVRTMLQYHPIRTARCGKNTLGNWIGIEAINQGYQVSFVPMGDLVHILKSQEISRKSQIKIKRMIDSDMVIIDDLMFF